MRLYPILYPHRCFFIVHQARVVVNCLVCQPWWLGLQHRLPRRPENPSLHIRRIHLPYRLDFRRIVLSSILVLKKMIAFLAMAEISIWLLGLRAHATPALEQSIFLPHHDLSILATGGRAPLRSNQGRIPLMMILGICSLSACGVQAWGLMTGLSLVLAHLLSWSECKKALPSKTRRLRTRAS